LIAYKHFNLSFSVEAKNLIFVSKKSPIILYLAQPKKMMNQFNLNKKSTVHLRLRKADLSSNWILLQVLAIIPINLLANWITGTCSFCQLIALLRW